MNAPETIRVKGAQKGSSNRVFGLVFGSVFIALAFLPTVTGPGPLRWYLLVPAAVFWVAALFVPRVLSPFNSMWTKLGLLMHRITNPIVMAAIYYGVLTPVGLVIRISGKDLLNLRRDPAASTYWLVRHDHRPASEAMRDQF